MKTLRVHISLYKTKKMYIYSYFFVFLLEGWIVWQRPFAQRAILDATEVFSAFLILVTNNGKSVPISLIQPPTPLLFLPRALQPLSFCTGLLLSMNQCGNCCSSLSPLCTLSRCSSQPHSGHARESHQARCQWRLQTEALKGWVHILIQDRYTHVYCQPNCCLKVETFWLLAMETYCQEIV